MTGTAVALIDRLIHHAEIIAIDGKSYRWRAAEVSRKGPAPRRRPDLSSLLQTSALFGVQQHRGFLEDLGYEASTAASVEQAIIAMAGSGPTSCLLDLMMPERSGLEALTYFRQHHRIVPVIVITADRRDESAKKAHAAGALAVVLKPFEMSTLESLGAQAIGPAPSP